MELQKFEEILLTDQCIKDICTKENNIMLSISWVNRINDPMNDKDCKVYLINHAGRTYFEYYENRSNFDLNRACLWIKAWKQFNDDQLEMVS